VQKQKPFPATVSSG